MRLVMAWIEQTKKSSRKSGGPQYYLQGLTEPSQLMLQRHETRPVRLWTQYGIIETGLTAVSSKVGRVGHDRVQSNRGKVASVAHQVAHWYRLKETDIERIEFSDSFDESKYFVIQPSHIKLYGRKQRRSLRHDSHPLTIVDGHHSALLTSQLRNPNQFSKSCRSWVQSQITSIVADHGRRLPHLDEPDLLRASGALQKLGINLGPFRGKGIDCPDATFAFLGYPEYPCQIELEKLSSGFKAPHHKKQGHHSQRIVVLCMEHDAPDVLRRYIDIIELRELDRLLREAA